MIILSRLIVILSLLFLFTPVVFATEKIDINTASLEQLDKIIGIGPVLAQRIIETRPFYSVDDLIKVEGIGEKTLQKIKDQDLAYVGGQLSSDDPIAADSQTEAEPLLDLLNETPGTVVESEENKSPLTYPSGIIINEILPSPEGPDAEEEWIELYNKNSFIVSLADWKLEDSIGQINTFVFPEDYQITANGFLVISRQTSRIILNNDKESLKLIQPDETVIDQVNFKDAVLGQSYERTKENNWLWTSSITPGFENILPEEQKIPEQTDGRINQELLPEPIDLDDQKATINGQEITVKNYYLFLFALLIAFFAGILVFVIRKKLDLKKKLK